MKGIEMPIDWNDIEKRREDALDTQVHLMEELEKISTDPATTRQLMIELIDATMRYNHFAQKLRTKKYSPLKRRLIQLLRK